MIRQLFISIEAIHVVILTDRSGVSPALSYNYGKEILPGDLSGKVWWCNFLENLLSRRSTDINEYLLAKYGFLPVVSGEKTVCWL